MPQSADTVSKLLCLLYEAAASPKHWPEFLTAIRQAAKVDTAHFILVDPEKRCDFSVNYGLNSKWEQAYAE